MQAKGWQKRKGGSLPGLGIVEGDFQYMESFLKQDMLGCRVQAEAADALGMLEAHNIIFKMRLGVT